MKLQAPPVQQPYVPLVVAGGGKRTLRLVANHADASNLAAESWGGAAATDADLRHKYEVLQAHCAELGRPYASVLRTYHFVPSLLADSPSALAVKRERVPPQLLALVGAGALVGTPEQAVERLQALVCAGCQYFSFAVLDPDTLRLLAERVVPAVASVAPTAPLMEHYRQRSAIVHGAVAQRCECRGARFRLLRYRLGECWARPQTLEQHHRGVELLSWRQRS